MNMSEIRMIGQALQNVMFKIIVLGKFPSAKIDALDN